jgi:sugar phosphate isomerase/epimerase
VRRDLAHARMGQLLGADHRTYSPVAARIERSEIEALVEGGCPVVTYLPGGRLVWHDEDDAWPAWADARSAAEAVTAGRWQAVDGATAVVLVWHE